MIDTATIVTEVLELTIPSIKDVSAGPVWSAWAADPQACVLTVEGNTIVAQLTLHD